MAGNPLSRVVPTLVVIAGKCADGAQLHGTVIGLLQCTEANIRLRIATTNGAQAAYGAAKSARGLAFKAKAAADEDVRKFLSNYVKVLGHFLGTNWSSAWEEAGFTQGSLALPDTVDARAGMLPVAKAYLVAHPGHQDGVMAVNESTADALIALAADTRQNADNSETLAEQAREAREVAVTKLYRFLRCLEAELMALIADDDPRWHAFGLNAPADPETPEAVDTPVVTLGPSGSHRFGLTWPHAMRAQRYHVWGLMPGTMTPVLLATVSDESATIESEPSGTAVGITIAAVNDAGEGVPSGEISVLSP